VTYSVRTAIEFGEITQNKGYYTVHWSNFNEF